jgi:Dolichyl-phosphate-mannose-protein mannosyltransferase
VNRLLPKQAAAVSLDDGVVASSPPLSLLERLGQVFEKLASSPLAVIAAFSAIYFPPTLWLAAHKLLWDDEFFTLYISSVPRWSEIIRALSTGADQHPPSFYYLTHLFITAFGTTHVTFRLPEILAFWTSCILLYFLARAFLGNTWGVVAMMIPLASGGTYNYASEARGYALLLAFSTMAFLCWANAALQYNRRALWLTLLGVALSCALASHYYAVLVVVALSLAELYRSYELKRFDWPVWCAFSCSIIPVILFLPVIRSSHQYAGHFWARPKWHLLYDFHPDMMGELPNALLGVAAFSLWVFSKGRRSKEETPVPLPSWMAVATMSFSLIPLFAMLLAKTITHGYVDRYAIPGTIGTCLLLTYLLRRVADIRSTAALLALVLCILTYSFNVYVLGYTNWTALVELKEDHYFLTHKGGQKPIVVDEVTIFHRLSFYGDPKLRQRLSYMADAGQAVKYLNQDTIDRGLLDLRPWFPINTVPACTYVRENPSFLVYGYVGTWTWVTYTLAKPGSGSELIGRKEDQLLFDVQNARALLSEYPIPVKGEEPPSLYEKFKDKDQSLCAIYMGSNQCPAL